MRLHHTHVYKACQVAAGFCERMRADCVFTDWSGHWSPIVAINKGAAVVRDTAFRNVLLPVELADVSNNGAVRFHNASLANVTLSRGSVVGTTTSDYTGALCRHVQAYR